MSQIALWLWLSRYLNQDVGVMTWKHVPYYWPIVRIILLTSGFPSQRAGKWWAFFVVFLFFLFDWTSWWTNESQMIWDAMTSLWRHYNVLCYNDVTIMCCAIVQWFDADLVCHQWCISSCRLFPELLSWCPVFKPNYSKKFIGRSANCRFHLRVPDLWVSWV